MINCKINAATYKFINNIQTFYLFSVLTTNSSQYSVKNVDYKDLNKPINFVFLLFRIIKDKRDCIIVYNETCTNSEKLRIKNKTIIKVLRTKSISNLFTRNLGLQRNKENDKDLNSEKESDIKKKNLRKSTTSLQKIAWLIIKLKTCSQIFTWIFLN